MIPGKGKNIKNITSIEDNALIKIEGRNGKETVAKWSDIKTALNSDLSFGADKGYKVYVAFLEQTGTNAPTANIIVNELSGPIVWSYGGIGTYTGTLAGAFTNLKTLIIPPQPYDQIPDSLQQRDVYSAGWNDANSIYLYTGTVNSSGVAQLNDEVLLDGFTFIEIRVYD